MKLAFVFPGQGSQSLAMLSELAASYPVIEQTFAEASQVLGYDLWALTQQGPVEQLNDTARTQPALLAASVALWRLWQQQSDKMPDVLAGHSLGEYSALVVAGVLEFKAAIALVERRGQLMQQAVPAGQGAMAAILGLDDEQVIAACHDAAEAEVVAAVNFNSPGQVVIAGNSAAVARAIEVCKALGAKRALPLPVSVPSHCLLMQPAALELEQYVNGLVLQAPQIPLINNVDVRIESEPSAIQAALVRQLYQPVRWTETVQALAASDVTHLIECGPGSVLSGLNKRIDKTLQLGSLTDAKALHQALELVKES